MSDLNRLGGLKKSGPKSVKGEGEGLDMSQLRKRPKANDAQTIRTAEEVGQELGFVDRANRKKPGRKPSPRTHQMHPKVMPECGQAISDEAARLGISQGQLIEIMWEQYSPK